MLALTPAAPVAATPGPDPAARGIDLSLRGLRRAFGDKAVLRGIDLDVPAGQFVAVVGRSGCGKSTLLRLLAGLDQPSGGRIRYGTPADHVPGASAAGHPGAAAPGDVRVMFQEPRLLPWASVLSNAEVGLGEDRGRADSRDRAAAALAAVGLGERGAEWPSVLSGGQKQRVALARALVSRPRMLALDEPLGALDALTRISMQRLLERVWLEQGFTAILVTHDVSEALALADRVLLIEEGRIALDLPVEVPRPRRRAAPELAALEERVLSELFRGSPPGEDA